MAHRIQAIERIVLAVACVLGLTLPALAQQPSSAQANAVRQACRGDYEAYCANVPPGGSAALSCLQQNSASLSEPCQAALGAMSGGGMSHQGNAVPPPATMPPPPPMTLRQEVEVLRYSCGRDYRAFCSYIRPGQGRAVACLEGNWSSLSRQCRSELLAARQGR